MEEISRRRSKKRVVSDHFLKPFRRTFWSSFFSFSLATFATRALWMIFFSFLQDSSSAIRGTRGLCRVWDRDILSLSLPPLRSPDHASSSLISAIICLIHHRQRYVSGVIHCNYYYQYLLLLSSSLWHFCGFFFLIFNIIVAWLTHLFLSFYLDFHHIFISLWHSSSISPHGNITF